MSDKIYFFLAVDNLAMFQILNVSAKGTLSIAAKYKGILPVTAEYKLLLEEYHFDVDQ